MRLPYVVLPHSTLNEHFNIQNDILPDATQLPAMRYFAIGNGGHTMTVGGNGVPKPDTLQHKGTDAALFNHLPFVLREVGNDISAVDRANYGLRRIEVHDGRNYIAYYLKRLEFTGVNVGLEMTHIEDGVKTVSAFVPDSSNLNPVPTPLSSSGVNLITGEYVSASAKLDVVFTETDFAELLNVGNILYGDDSYAIISEIAFVSGVDKIVQSPTGDNSTINFNEVIIAQIMSHIGAFVTPKFSNYGSALQFDVGSTEPLFGLA